MLNWIALYFGFNLVFLILLWLAAKPKEISFIGYFIMMLLVGLPILILLLVLFAVALVGGASYNLGDTIEGWFSGLRAKR